MWKSWPYEIIIEKQNSMEKIYGNKIVSLFTNFAFNLEEILLLNSFFTILHYFFF